MSKRSAGGRRVTPPLAAIAAAAGSWLALAAFAPFLISGCERERPPLPDSAAQENEAQPVGAPEIPGESQSFLDMQLPPNQLVRVLPTGDTYAAADAGDAAPAFRSLCLNCHAVSQTSFAVDAWGESAHARAGITCGACHGAHEEAFVSRPEAGACRHCHAPQYDEFLSSAHGPEKAPGMGCGSCHEIHATDRGSAAMVTTCTGCHLESEHVQGYPFSKMGVVFTREGYDDAGDLRAPDCVYCHMPPSPLMAVTGDFRNDKVTLHDHALTVAKDTKDASRLSGEAVEFLTPLCLKCHSERNTLHRLENSASLLLDWTPVGMTRETRRKPVPGGGVAPGGNAGTGSNGEAP